MDYNFDIVIIGAGAVGCAIARELSSYKGKIAVLEKECDAGAGTSGRNSAVVHAGFNNRPGTLMAKFCVEGNEHFEELCKELDVPYKKTGKLLVGFDEDDRAALEKLVAQGQANGCKGLHIIEKEDVDALAPGVGGICAMHSPNTAVFDPFLYTLSLAENAFENGVKFFFGNKVCSIKRSSEIYSSAQPAGIPDFENLTSATQLSDIHFSEVTASSASHGPEDQRTEAATKENVQIDASNSPVKKTDKADTSGSFIINTENGHDDTSGSFIINTENGHTFTAKIVINCAGLGCNEISKMAGVDDYSIYPCRGEYLILDKAALKLIDIPVYPVPRPGIGGLGVHLTPTVHGNVIIGPNAEYLDDGEDYATVKSTTDDLFAQACKLLPSLRRNLIIGTYSGIRSKQTNPQTGGYADFVIKEEEKVPGFINLIGIESPGMTASMPIARYVRDIVGRTLTLEKNPDFNPIHKNPVKFASQTPQVQAQLIAENKEYGEVVCRCNTITKAEIRQAIENPFGVKSVTAIKYRAWATTGRCNGGYCLARIADLLVKEYGLKPEEITYRGEGSEMFSGRVK